METETTIYELIEAYMPVLKNVMCTDITRDGMLGGVSLELYRELVLVTRILRLSHPGELVGWRIFKRWRMWGFLP